MSIIESAVSWAERIATDNSHGYSNTNRNGPNYDCSGLVNNAWQQAGVPVRTSGASYTGDMLKAYQACGFKNVTASVNLDSCAGMQRGDVLWSSGHTALYCGSCRIVHARGTDGHPESGDQSGREICIDKYYRFATCVLRYPESGVYVGTSDGNFVPITKTEKTKGVTGAVSAKTIYDSLVSGGLSTAGVCGVLGNLDWESGGLIPNNVENRSGINDAIYTAAVDNGSYSKDDFSKDTFGYGLAQWTFSTRKAGLYDYAKSKGVSIGDPAMQCSYLIVELKRDFPKLYDYLCNTSDYEEATRKFCDEFERPAVGNHKDRIALSKKYYDMFGNNEKADASANLQDAKEQFLKDNGVQQTVPKKSFWMLLLEILGFVKPAADVVITPDIVDGERSNVKIRVLSKGAKGRDVFLLQCALLDMKISVGAYGADGDFGGDTEAGVKEFQSLNGLSQTGICTGEVWQKIFK